MKKQQFLFLFAILPFAGSLFADACAEETESLDAFIEELIVDSSEIEEVSQSMSPKDKKRSTSATSSRSKIKDPRQNSNRPRVTHRNTEPKPGSKTSALEIDNQSKSEKAEQRTEEANANPSEQKTAKEEKNQ